MIRAITEVGVAVCDIEQATRMMVERLCAVAGPVQVAERFDMKFCMCRVGNVDFELMAPIGKDGVIARFIERHGEGLHHIGFAVDDVAESQAEMTSHGMKFVDATPGKMYFRFSDLAGKAGEGDVGFTFSRPDSLLGMLLEFIEYPLNSVASSERTGSD